MTAASSVRTSRDGDQFHYLWAARRCLLLLAPSSGLVAVTVEGPSPEEGASVTAGTDQIDVGEYYGSEELAEAKLIRYTQLKHSTLRTSAHWTPSELKRTLAGFAERYSRLSQTIGPAQTVSKLQFSFVSNRPIGPDILGAIEAASEGRPYANAAIGRKLERIAGLKGAEWADFCTTLRFIGTEPSYWDQRKVLRQDVSGYLPEADTDAPTQLKELVTRKALSESAGNPTIRRMDVLRALHTDENQLFPAPCLIAQMSSPVPRSQERELVDRIVRAIEGPVLIHAPSGVGKSILASRIGVGLPAGSVTVVYDCFGNGQYRSASGYRHRHKDAFVQITNELASRGLCHPLIPTVRADSSAYANAFLHRLSQCAAMLQQDAPDALLCIVIDAADNAQMAADEIGEARSFVVDLIRERAPPGVRFVFTARPHRIPLLNSPPSTIRLELQPFDLQESATHLRLIHPEASDLDAQEFHRLSSHNPRVQALALSKGDILAETLRKLGPNPTTVEVAIDTLLDASIAKLIDAAPGTERLQVERMCAGLAVLRPLVPISVLAALAGVEASAVRSFAIDLGRPLLVSGDSIQFLDEPVETWFRERFRPNVSALKDFVEHLKPMALEDAYVASVLPQLMLESGEFNELVSLALSSGGLPNTSELQKKDIELRRLQFALKASLRLRQYKAAAMLAFKAGNESAGDERKWSSIEENCDLAARFMSAEQVEEVVARRTFGSGWLGSHHAYEAGIMSGRAELRAEARSRLRMAEEWLSNWAGLPKEERTKEPVTAEDVAELAMAHLNVHGSGDCAASLLRWSPKSLVFRAGRLLTKRLVDHGRFAELDELALAQSDISLTLAIALELRAVLRSPPASAVKRALTVIRKKGFSIGFLDRAQGGGHYTGLEALTAIVEAAHTHSLAKPSVLAAVLSKALPESPPRSLSARYSSFRFELLRAYALRAELLGSRLELSDLAHASLRKELEDAKRHQDTEELSELKEVVGSLLPWHRLWAKALLGHIGKDDVAAGIRIASDESTKAERHAYRERHHTTDEIARLRFEVFVLTQCSTLDEFTSWANTSIRRISAGGLVRLARLAAHSQATAEALDFASAAFAIFREERIDAQTKTENLINLARSTCSASLDDSRAYFDEAISVSSKVGDENLARWAAVLELANSSSSPEVAPQLAYEVSRAAELTYEYVERDKHFDWQGTVEAIVGLCPSSSIAILSRWRDRSFGWQERLLAMVVEALVKRTRVSAPLALALLPFKAHWNEEQLLRAAFSQSGSSSRRQRLAGHVFRYMSLSSRSAEDWAAMAKALSDGGVGLPEAGLRADFEGRKRNEASERLAAFDRKDDRDWQPVFDGLELTSAEDIELAYARLRNSEPPYYDEHFFRNACLRVKAGMEVQFVSALVNARFVTWREFAVFLYEQPDQWKARPAIKTAMHDALGQLARRHCLEISKGGYYGGKYFLDVASGAGVATQALAEMVLSALGETTENLNSDRLFSAVGLVALCLDAPESREALRFALEQFKPLLREQDGDGPWRKELAPPAEIDESVAGYIWAALGAPESSTRWEAAHAVKALCSLGEAKTLSQVVQYAQGNGDQRAFVDSGLMFYEHNARQWLFIALARSALASPVAVAPHADFVALHATPTGEEHLLVRKFAANATIALIDAGLAPALASRRREFESALVSPLKKRLGEREEGAAAAPEEGSDDKEFFFGIDMGPYWFDSLGRVFGKSQVEIERRARQVLNEWGYVGTGRWDEDQRGRRRLYRDDETRHSHGSSPRTDDLRFYLSYHAMMVVAGRLLATEPVRDLPDDSYGSFSEWLSCHALSRPDGRWLFDRREPTPLEWPTWKEEQQRSEDWRWSVARQDFDRCLGLSSEMLNVWGYWTAIGGEREETAHVSSALVSGDLSMALLKALQTTRNSRDYRIPHAGDDMEIDSGPFRLKGWVAERDGSSRLDEYDSWAGGVRWPPHAPANYVADSLNLYSDPEGKIWRQGGAAGKVVLVSQVWGQRSGRRDDEEGENGTRLQATHAFVRGMLAEFQMDLIVEVTVERRVRRSSYQGDYSDDGGYFAPYARLFVFKSDGSIHSL